MKLIDCQLLIQKSICDRMQKAVECGDRELALAYLEELREIGETNLYIMSVLSAGFEVISPVRDIEKLYEP